MKTSRAKKGQFSIIAALLVSVILVTAVISTYTMVRNAPLQDSPKVLTAIGEMNTDIKRILDFTVGYYGSILRVTGNSTYASGLTTRYLSSGLVNIARSHPEWNPSFELNSDHHVSTRWFMPESYSMGDISITYSLASLGIEGVKYETSSALYVTMLESDLGAARIRVTRDNAEPELGLSKENFWFYNYTDDSTWELVNPTALTISSNGVYDIPLPLGIDQNAYSVQVEDRRGLVVTAFYSQESVASGLGIPHYTYTFDWASTGVLDIYEDLSTDTFAIEVLQNGTLKWLGQPLDLTPYARPIPPISIKSLRVNATTTTGVNQEIPFQVEDWASDYKIPLGLAGNESLFNNNNMLVFLVNNDISEVTLWWDGNDVATQTSFAWENLYFDDDPSSGTLDNGFLYLDVNNFYVLSNVIGEYADYRTDFLRVGDEMPDYGADPAYVIYNGVVRDIVQQEPEYGGGGVAGCPNFYSQVFLTLPANTPYYTYAVRTIFVDSPQPRTIDDLSVIQLSDLTGTPLTEDGTDGGYPETSPSTGRFYDGYPTDWGHHWSQISSGNTGAGVMFTDGDNQNLYVFDTVDERGALNVQSNIIEVNPVDPTLSSVSFTNSRDLTWYGAVVTFDGEPIYTSPANGHVGLWVMVENPPSVSMDEYEAETPSPPEGSIITDYVDGMSNVDSSPDKGSHSDFPAQQDGQNSVCDILTEENSGGSGATSLIDVESFEDSWPPAGWAETGRWNKESDQKYAGSYSADFDGGSGYSGYLTTPDLDCSDASAIQVDFWYRDDGSEAGEFVVQYYDGTSWNSVADLGATSQEDQWHHYQEEITDSQYFKSTFKIRWSVNTNYSNDVVYVDLVTITKDSGQTNYNLDLEVQWTNVDYDETNEELCIYMAEQSGGTSNTDSLDATGGYMVVGNGYSNWGSTAGTISFWIQWDTVDGRPWGQHDNMETRISGTNLILDWGSSSSLTSSTSFTAGKWYFIAIVWNENTDDLYLYVGDQSTAPLEDAHNNAWTSTVSDEGVTRNNFMAAKNGVGPTNGHGDDLRYWDIDRTLTEIQSDYDIELTGSETNLRSYFTLNNNFDDIGPDNNDGSGSGSYVFSTDVPFSLSVPESLQVDVWTGSAWETVISALNVGWNNVTVSSYLTSSTFTIRFVGTTETGDTTQDYWTIDATLIRSWS